MLYWLSYALEDHFGPFRLLRSHAFLLATGTFLASFFTESEINDLMLAALKERAAVRPVDGWDYLKYHGYEAGDVLYREAND